MYRSTPPSLSCPECAIGLSPVDGGGGVAVYVCGKCGGVWIEPEASNAVLQDKIDPSSAQRASKPPAPRAKGVVEAPRPCARCSEAMLPYPFGDAMLDSCPAHGTWFDHDELTRVVKAAHAMAKRAARKNLVDLPTGQDVWAIAKFTVGMVTMPFELIGGVLGDATRSARERIDDLYDDRDD